MAPPRPWDIDQQRGAAYRQGGSTSYRVPTTTTSRTGSTPMSQYGSWAERNMPSGGAVVDPRTGRLSSAFSVYNPERETRAWGEWTRSGNNLPSIPQMPQLPGGPGGPGGGGGGGGGGGLTPEQQAALARFFGQGPAKYQLPAYTPFEMSPRDTAIFEAARKRIQGAAQGDRTRATGLFDDLDAQLAGQRNVFQNANMTMTPQMAQAYQRIVGGAPGNAQVANVIGGENAYSTNSDGAFRNLMAMLASQEGRNMQSRSREAMQARQGVLSGIDAQASGMLGGVEMSDLQDARRYGERKDDYRFNEGRYMDERAMQAAFGNTDISNDWMKTILEWLPMITDKGILGGLQPAPYINNAATVGAGAVRG